MIKKDLLVNCNGKIIESSVCLNCLLYHGRENNKILCLQDELEDNKNLKKLSDVYKNIEFGSKKGE